MCNLYKSLTLTKLLNYYKNMLENKYESRKEKRRPKEISIRGETAGPYDVPERMGLVLGGIPIVLEYSYANGEWYLDRNPNAEDPSRKKQLERVLWARVGDAWQINFGRNPSSPGKEGGGIVTLKGQTVSRRHLNIRIEEGLGIIYTDLSTNGTKIYPTYP